MTEPDGASCIARWLLGVLSNSPQTSVLHAIGPRHAIRDLRLLHDEQQL